MQKQNLLAGLMALALVAGLWGWVAYRGKQNRLMISGSILKVRSHTAQPGSTLAVLDFRVSNPSPQQLVVQECKVFLDDKEGHSIEGTVASEGEAVRILDHYKILGPKFNETLLTRTRINPGDTLDRMIVAQFPLSDADVTARRTVRLVILDVDGASFDVVEKP